MLFRVVHGKVKAHRLANADSASNRELVNY